MTTQPAISSRKADHIDLCTDGDVAFRTKTTLFDAIEFVHNALPEMAVSDVDLTANFAGKTLRAPIVMAAMTGGVDRADAINRDLATVAQEFGIGFAFGSQRPLLTDGITEGYRVRDVAPDALVLGNIGVVQARAARSEDQSHKRLLQGLLKSSLVLHHIAPGHHVVRNSRPLSGLRPAGAARSPARSTQPPYRRRSCASPPSLLFRCPPRWPSRRRRAFLRMPP